MTDIIIIGAGIAGLACARPLADAGLHVIIIDKGRGIGGRVATRRADDLRFDHGAPYARAQGPNLTTYYVACAIKATQPRGPIVRGRCGQ